MRNSENSCTHQVKKVSLIMFLLLPNIAIFYTLIYYLSRIYSPPSTVKTKFNLHVPSQIKKFIFYHFFPFTTEFGIDQFQKCIRL